MKSTADLVLGKALRAQSENAHERQWGSLVNQLLCEVEAWQKWPGQVVVLNVYDLSTSKTFHQTLLTGVPQRVVQYPTCRDPFKETRWARY